MERNEEKDQVEDRVLEPRRSKRQRNVVSYTPKKHKITQSQDSNMAATKGKAAKKADAPATEPVENKDDKEAKTPEEEPEAEETSNEAPPPKKPAAKSKKGRKRGRRSVKRAGKAKKSS